MWSLGLVVSLPPSHTHMEPLWTTQTYVHCTNSGHCSRVMQSCSLFHSAENATACSLATRASMHLTISLFLYMSDELELCWKCLVHISPCVSILEGSSSKKLLATSQIPMPHVWLQCDSGPDTYTCSRMPTTTLFWSGNLLFGFQQGHLKRVKWQQVFTAWLFPQEMGWCFWKGKCIRERIDRLLGPFNFILTPK